MGEQAKKRFIINALFLLIWGGVIFFAGKFLMKYLFPFIVAVIVAALVQRPAELISRKSALKKGICAAFLSAVIYIFAAFLCIFGIFKFMSFSGELAALLSDWGILELFERLTKVINEFLENFSPENQSLVNDALNEMFMSLTGKLTSFLSSAVTGAAKAAPSFLFSSLVALAATCYIAKDFDGLARFIKSFIKEENREKTEKILKILKSSVLKLLKGYAILMLLTFLELSLGLWLLQVKNGVLIALLIALVDILPVLGAGAVLIPWGIVNVALGNRFLGLGLLVIYLSVTVIRNFAEPKIVGDKMGINPLFILISMFLGLKTFGFIGIIILPVTLIVVVKYYKNEMIS